MHPKFRLLWLVAAAVLLLILPPAYFLNAERRDPGSEPVRVLTKYLKLLYARDFNQAYRFISSQDQKLKTAKLYVRERGAFTGFTSEVARHLAEQIEVRPVDQQWDGDRLRIKLAMNLPDANAVAPVLLNWDEEKLNTLPLIARNKILTLLEKLNRYGKLKRIDGEEEFVLIKEGSQWKVFLDWAAGVRVSFRAIVPEPGEFAAQAVIKETVARPNELFTVAYKVKNRSHKDLFARITHRIEPPALAQYLDIVECALLLPVRVLAGNEQEYASTYLVRGDLPEGAKELNVTYEFKVER